MVTPSRLSEARVILEFAPDLANQLLRGGPIAFSAAYEEASQRKAEAESNEEKLATLLKDAPDLADLAGMSLQAALDKLEQRKTDAAQLATIKDAAPDLVALASQGSPHVGFGCARGGARARGSETRRADRRDLAAGASRTSDRHRRAAEANRIMREVGVTKQEVYKRLGIAAR
jgi:hypothetical protein